MSKNRKLVNVKSSFKSLLLRDLSYLRTNLFVWMFLGSAWWSGRPCTLARLNPRGEKLTLDYCGRSCPLGSPGEHYQNTLPKVTGHCHHLWPHVWAHDWRGWANHWPPSEGGESCQTDQVGQNLSWESAVIAWWKTLSGSITTPTSERASPTSQWRFGTGSLNWLCSKPLLKSD